MRLTLWIIFLISYIYLMLMYFRSPEAEENVEVEEPMEEDQEKWANDAKEFCSG